jgi:hypothetical protein
MTPGRTRIDRVRTGRDDGISLAELIVAMALSVMLLVFMGGFFTAIVRGTQASSASDISTRQASNAINTMVQYFHAATTYPVQGQITPNPAFTNIGATDVTFYAYVNLISSTEQPVKVRFFVDPTSHYLVEQLWSSTCSASVAKPLFSYLDSSGNPVAVPLNITNPANATALASIDDVAINLEVGSTATDNPGNSHVSTIVGLLNLGQAGAGTS